MTVKETVKETILKLETLCESYEKESVVEFNDLEKAVTHLSDAVQTVDIASDQILKKELNVLQSALRKLSSTLNLQQENLARQAQGLNLHQRALHAYAHVANNNLGAMA